MPREDEITYEILPDGTIKWSTSKISAANHSSADEFLKEVERLAGGSTTKTKRQSAHAHAHAEEHQHG